VHLLGRCPQAPSGLVIAGYDEANEVHFVPRVDAESWRALPRSTSRVLNEFKRRSTVAQRQLNREA